MADIDVLPQRGIPRMALVDANGVATNGTQTVAQLAAKGMRSACAVDGSGNATTGGGTMLQLAQRGIKAFCPVDENGVALDASTAATLRQRGIRPMVLLNNSGVALTGSATMLTLAQRGLESFCPLDEGGNATTMGAVVLLSNTTVLDNATVGTNVGTLSVSGGTGTYTFTLTSNPGSLFATAGTNGVNLNTAAALTVGDKPITVQAAGGVPTPVSRAFIITVAPSPTLPVNTVLPVISGIPSLGQTLTTTNGTWTGFPAPGFTYQWKRGGVAISGATGVTYLLVSADVGTNITVTVTATNTAGNVSATSTAVGLISGSAIILTAGTGAFTLAGEDMTPLAGWTLTTGAGGFAMVGQDATLTPPVPPATTVWNNADKGDWAVSGSPALVITGGVIGGTQIIRATNGHSTGKYYFEFVVSAMNTNTGCGFANAAFPLSGTFLGSNADGMSYLPSGTVFVSNFQPHSQIGTFAAGNVVGLAINLTTRKFWGRVGSGLWNNVAGEDPATGTGGVDLSSFTAGVNYFPTGFDNATSGVLTANFGQAAYANAAPAGFLNW